MDNKNVVIINDKRYLIVEKVAYKGKNFAYLINSNDEKDTMFVELEDNVVREIPNDIFATDIFPLFVEKFSEGG